MHLDATIWARFGLLALISAMGGCLVNGEPGDNGELDGTDGTEAPIIGGSIASAYPEAALVNMLVNGKPTAACSGAVIAPKVVLTAGHCVFGFNGWSITAPFAGTQKATSSSAVTYDWKVTGQFVDPKYHDIGLVFLDQPINLASYPKIASTPVANGGQIVNIGRIDNGKFSNTALFVSKPITVTDGKSIGFPLDYAATEVIESGDSGGPDMLVGTHTIVAVNSGAGGGTEVLARTDLLSAWIKSQVDAHGGPGQGGGTDPGGGGQQPPPGGPSETEPNDSFGQPNALSGSLSGSLSGGDRDWFTWSVASAGVPYEVQIKPTGDAQIQMWKLVDGSYHQVANTTTTSFNHTSSGAGKYVVGAFSPSGQQQTYTITLTK